MGYLFLWVLFLKDTIEIRNNMPIYVVNPYSTVGAESRIFTWEEGNTRIKLFELQKTLLNTWHQRDWRVRWSTHIFEQHCALVAAPIAVLQSWYKPPRIDC